MSTITQYIKYWSGWYDKQQKRLNEEDFGKIIHDKSTRVSLLPYTYEIKVTDNRDKWKSVRLSVCTNDGWVIDMKEV